MIKGFEEVKPMVFAGIFPVDTDEFEELRDCMDKLQLNDASLTFELETSQALGFWISLRISWECCTWRSSRKGWKGNLTKQLSQLFPT